MFVPATVLAEPTTTTTTQAPTPEARNVVLEITGAGTVYSIDVDPGGRVPPDKVTVPFKTSTDVDAGTQTGAQGCRITVDGVVVVMQRPGNPHCIYTLPDQ